MWRLSVSGLYEDHEQTVHRSARPRCLLIQALQALIVAVGGVIAQWALIGVLHHVPFHFVLRNRLRLEGVPMLCFDFDWHDWHS